MSKLKERLTWLISWIKPVKMKTMFNDLEIKDVLKVKQFYESPEDGIVEYLNEDQGLVYYRRLDDPAIYSVPVTLFVKQFTFLKQ